MIFGASVSIAVGCATIALGTPIAAALGISSGYFGGTYDLVVQRVVDAWMSFPYLVIIRSVMAVLGPGLLNVILSLSIIVAATGSRVIRSTTISVAQNAFVEAARAMGSGRTYMYRSPWMAVWPGVAISLAVFAFNMLGDALRDVLDPRLRGA